MIKFVNYAKERLSRVDGDFQKLIKNSTWVLVGGGLSSLIVVLQAAIIARSLGVIQYGYLAILQSTLGIVGQFMEFRTWEVAIKYYPENWQKKSWSLQDLVFILLLIDVFAGIIGFVIYYLLSDFIAMKLAHDITLSPIIKIYGLMLPVTFVSAGTFVGILRKVDMFHIISIKSLILSVLDLIGIAILTSLGFGLEQVIILFVVVEWLNCFSSIIIMYFVLINRYGVNNLKFTSPTAAFIEIRSFLLQAWVSGTIRGLQSRIDIPLLGAFTNATVVGIYKLANDIASLFTRIGNPIQSAILPILVEYSNSDKIIEIKSIIIRLVKILLYILIPIICVISFWGEPIMIKVGGTNYAGAGLPFIFLSIGGAATIIFVWARPLLVARNRITISNTINIIFTILEVVLIYILGIRFEAIGASIAMMIVLLGSSITMAYFSLLTLREAEG